MYFCRDCDEQHEAQSWLTWLEQQLHFGVMTWRAQVRLADRLAGRIRWALYRQNSDESMRHVWFEEAVCWAGESAKGVLGWLVVTEARFGRHGNQRKGNSN